MNIKATDFCDVSNSAGGVIKAINELQSGDTLIFPKNEYHFYKDRCIHKVCHMTNTDSFKAPDKYFAVLPNAGYPQVVSGRMVFDDNNAAYFSQIMHDLAEDGADIIGGCCGTTPEYIRQMVLKTADVVHKKNASIEEEITEKKTANDVSFYKGKEGRKLIAVELAPPLGIDDEKIMDAAFLMKESGVDVLTFPDSP